MIKYIYSKINFLIIILLCIVFNVVEAQKAQNVNILESNINRSVLACSDQDAGTISLGSFIGSSNDIDLTLMYLCLGDRINIDHDANSEDLTGDPVPFTTPGIGYAFYTCPPTISGPDLATILTDPCLLTNPVPINDIWIAQGTNPDGDILFNNTGDAQNFANGGDPVLLYFAPITIDDFDALAFESSGQCTNVRVDQQFAVVYLNEIEISNITNTDANGCGASFVVSGGLPQYDNSNYTNISITLASDPSVSATIINSNISHGGIVNFTVPQSGIYNVVISDDKACPFIGMVDMTSCSTLVFNASDEVANGTACVEISVESFNNITSFQSTLNWDPTVLTFDNVSSFNLTGLGVSAFGVTDVANGVITFSWIDFGGGITVPDNTVIFELCFTVGANAGTSTVFFDDTPLMTSGSNIDGTIGVTSNNGSVVTSNLILGTCNTPNVGAATGSLLITPYGNSPFTYTWESVGIVPPVNGAGNITNAGDIEEIPNLMDGQYSVTLVDNTGTNYMETATVGVGPTLFVQLNSINPTCVGDLDGQVMTNVQGGTMVYNYEWSNGASTANIANLGTGNYEVTVTDQTGCVRTANESIGVIPIASNISSIDPFCTGGSDGSITVAPIGGTSATGDYLIEWSNNFNETVSNSTINNLDGGQYYVTITDDNNCSVLDSVDLMIQNPISLVFQKTENNCYGDSVGFLLVVPQWTVVGGFGWDYDWQGLPFPSSDLPSSTAAGGLPAGVYYLNCINQNFPQCNIDTTFVFDPIDSISLSVASVSDATCMPGNDGVIDVNVSGGTVAADYTYNWSDMQNTQDAVNLDGGDYTLIVTDDNGCMDTISATVDVPLPPVIDTIFSDSTTCAGSSDGSLNVITSIGSTPIVLYDWSNMATGQQINNLASGEYIVTVTDAGGCTLVDTGYVYSPTAMMVTDTVYTLPNCAGSSTGALGLTVTGGQPPYNFDWDGGPNGNFATYPLIPAGTYNVTITDANNCGPITLSLTLQDPPSLSIDFTNIVQVSCYESTGVDCDGQVTATASGGTSGSNIFNYNWASGQQDISVASSTSLGNCRGYVVLTASDANNCFVTDSVFIGSPDSLMIDLDNSAVNPALCFGTNTGNAFVQVQGGTQDYNYQWVGGPNTQLYNNIGQGIYTINITDALGCMTSTQVVITEPQELVLDIDLLNTTNPSCNGYNDGQVGTVFSGGNPGGHVYSWTDNVSNAAFADNLIEGTYTATIIDINNCQDTAQFTLTDPDPISFVVTDIVEPLCNGQQTYVKLDTAYGGNGPEYTFSVNFGPQVPLVDSVLAFAGEDVPLVVYDINGCFVESSVSITEPTAIVLNLGPDVEIQLGESTVIGIQSFYSEFGIDTLMWTPDYNISALDTAFVEVSPIKSTTYTLTLFDDNGCLATDDIRVSIDKNRNIFIPDAFTPNNDGNNDIFQVFAGVGVTKVNFMRIFDRWGELVYNLEDFEPQFNNHLGWDGSKNGKILNQGVFVYIVEVVFDDGVVLLYRGDLTLLK